MLSDKVETTGIGRNRTGLTTHPEQSRDLVAAACSAELGSAGDATTIAAQRLKFAREKAPGGTGSLPRLPHERPTSGPVPVLGIAHLLDKLGERLHFERSSVRLYEALLTKRRQYDGSDLDEPDGLANLPSQEELTRIRDEELAHFALLQKTIVELGGDPTVVTPSADLSAVIGQGLPMVLTDPRTDLPQALLAILAAELQDNEGWHLLIALAQAARPELVEPLCAALRAEEHHLEQIRRWLLAMTTRSVPAH